MYFPVKRSAVLILFFSPLSFLATANNLSSSKDVEDKCLYPAKYFKETFLEQGLAETFKDCPSLATFIKQSAFDEAVIVFANPTLSTPMSYFGHNFLIFRKSESLNFSKVYSYSAVIPDGIPFISLVNKAIFGGLTGRYSFANFYDVAKEYLVKEQRSLILYTLKLSKVEKSLLLLKAYELYSLNSSYNFFNKNCTTELLTLLASISPRFSNLVNINSYLQPSELINILLENNLVELTPQVLLPDIEILYKSYYSKKQLERKRIDNFIKFNEIDHYGLSDSSKYDLNLISNIKFNYENKSLANYQIIKNMHYIKPEHKPTAGHDLIASLPPNEIRLGFETVENKSFLKIGYKPSFISRQKVKINNIYSGTLNILNTELSIFDDDAFISKFDLIEIESFATSFSVMDFNSWRIYIGSGDKSKLNGNLKWGLDLAYGKTWGTKDFQVSVLPQLSYSFNNNTLDLALFNDLLWRTNHGNINLTVITKITSEDKNDVVVSYQSKPFLANYSFTAKYSVKPEIFDFNINYRF
ncbi:MAG: DUF4105 domain-containing protein [Thalassotalea sp.]